MLKFILGNSILYTFANYLPLLANIIILPIITPYLTTFDYGIYGLVFAYISGLSFLSDLGLTVLFQNSYFKTNENYKELWSKYLGLRLIGNTIYSIILIVVLYFSLNNKVNSGVLVEILLLIGIPVLFFEVTKSIGIRWCQYSGNHRKVHIATFTGAIISLTSTYYCIYHLRMGYLGWFVSNLVTNFFLFIYYSKIIYIDLKVIPKFFLDLPFVKKSLKVSLPLVPHSFSGYLINTSDRVMLDCFKVNINSIGNYNLAYSYSNYFQSFNNSMGTVLTPIYLSRLEKKNEDKSVAILIISWMILSVFISFNLCLWSREIFAFLYRNASLNSVYPYCIFILMGMNYFPMYSAAILKLIYLEQTKTILRISVIGGVINILLNILLINAYGIKATVFSSFISYLYMGFSGFFISSIRKHISFNYRPLFWLSLIIVLSILVFYAVNLSFIQKIPITLFSLLSVSILYFSNKKSLSGILKQDS